MGKFFLFPLFLCFKISHCDALNIVCSKMLRIKHGTKAEVTTAILLSSQFSSTTFFGSLQKRGSSRKESTNFLAILPAHHLIGCACTFSNPVHCVMWDEVLLGEMSCHMVRWM